MPGGVGAVSQSIASAGGRSERVMATARNPNEIFYNLDSHQAYYDTAEHLLYFVDAPGGTVSQTITAALQGLRSDATVEQAYLDPHGCFSGASRVRLEGAQIDTLLVALKLSGVRTTVR